jgi:hypothetical protein
MKYRLKKEKVFEEMRFWPTSITEKFYQNWHGRFYFDKWYEGEEHLKMNTISIYLNKGRFATFSKDCFISEKDLHNEQFNNKMERLLNGEME